MSKLVILTYSAHAFHISCVMYVHETGSMKLDQLISIHSAKVLSISIHSAKFFWLYSNEAWMSVHCFKKVLKSELKHSCLLIPSHRTLDSRIRLFVPSQCINVCFTDLCKHRSDTGRVNQFCWHYFKVILIEGSGRPNESCIYSAKFHPSWGQPVFDRTTQDHTHILWVWILSFSTKQINMGWHFLRG